MRPWHLGNTTVRSPFRLRDGLIAISTSPLQGNLRGGLQQDTALRQLLGEHGIVELGEDETQSVGRKWRSALGKLGFLYPVVPTASGVSQDDLGPVDMITPNGWRLIRAETVPAMQECFLRALAAYYIPSPLETGYDFSTFSPLRHTLSVMLELEQATGESRLNFIEMALVVQLTNSDNPIADVVTQVRELRGRRESADSKRRFDREAREAAAETHQYAAQTFNDYADTNIRYLKATGLVQGKGRGLSLTPEKHLFIEKIVQDTEIPATPLAYFTALCDGARLPTDNRDTAILVLNNLTEQLQTRNIPFQIRDYPLDTVHDIAIARFAVEELLSEHNEEFYADQQATMWEEIAAYMDLLITGRRSRTLADGEEIRILQGEAPAYFEWTLWRAFLAVDSLRNRPYQARRFKIDQDFLPVGTAPGNGPDMLFEFEHFILVVEVTLTESSRQEAAEGEPVRRHVADLVLTYQAQTEKPVYGLFIANRIDSNTAETFRIGVWYTREDDRMRLDIVPLTLTQFKSFFEALFSSRQEKVGAIQALLTRCSELRPDHQAPAWKQEIERTVHEHIAQLVQ